MTFDDLPSGATVFLDANVLVYAEAPHPVHGIACNRLLDRIEHQDLEAYTFADVLGDVAHRLMTIEASDRFGWPVQGIANRLRRHPSDIQQLVIPRRAVDEIIAARVGIVPVTAQHVSTAASLDADFDRVPGITRYAPA